MAKKEIVNVISVKTENSEKTIKALKNEISLLKRELDNAVIGSDEFEQASRSLVAAQGELKNALMQSSENALSLKGSYNSLVAQMAALKKEWRATADVAKRNDLGRQIDNINTQLKELDNTLGNNQRKVGSYAEEFKKAMEEQQQSTIVTTSKLESLQKMATGLASGYAALQGAMNLLNIENEDLNKALVKVQSAMAIAQGVGGLKDFVEGFGKAKVAFKGATAGVKTFIGSLHGVKGAIVSTGIGALVVALGMLIANWEKISKMFNNTDPIEKTKKEIENLNEKFEVNDSLMKKANDEAYIKYLENLKAVKDDAEAAAAVMKTYNEELKNNERQLLIDNKLQAEFLQKQANTDFAIVKAAGFKESSKQYKEAEQNYLDATAAANKAQMALAVFDGKQIEEQAKATIDANNKKIESDKQAAEQRKAAAKELADKRKQFSREIFESTLDDEQKQLLHLTEKYEEGKNLFKNNKEKLLELEEWYRNERLKIVIGGIDEEIAAEKAAAEEAAEKKLAASEKRLDKKLSGIDSATEMQIYTTERKKPSGNGQINSIDTEIEKINELINITNAALNDKIAAIEFEQQLFEESTERWIELEEQKVAVKEQSNRTINELNEQLNEQEKARNRAMAANVTKVFTQSLQSASQIIGALQEGIDTTTKEGFEKNKKMQIANATIGMLVGITNALAGAYTTKSGPWDWVLAGVQAATIATTGGIQIANIKKQQFNGSGGSSATPSVTPSYTMTELPVTYTRNVQTNTEIEELNQPIKAYVVESDIADVQKKVEDRTKNTEF